MPETPPSDLAAQINAHTGSHYQVVREIGRGGMAVVFLASDLRHGRQVAVKVLRPEVSDGVAAERFHREIRIAARLTHPRIVSVIDSGDANGVLYYIMPFIDAPTLREHLTGRGSLPYTEAAGIARDVARALAHAHSCGVIHRDVKPENIMLPGGEAVVTDFGIARAVEGAGGTTLTQAGMASGTPLYMSPEQALGEGDAASDVYSLGCVLFELLTGRPPFEGHNAMAILTRHTMEHAPRISSINREIPQWLSQIVARCLAKKPEDRLSAAELESLLDPAKHLTGFAIAPASSERTVAVLPFSDLTAGAGHAYLCEGIAEEVLTAIANVSGLRVVSRASSFALRDSALSAHEKARRMGATSLLDGSVQAAGDRLRVNVRLSNSSDGLQIWSRRFDGSAQDVFAIEDQITRAVVEQLQPEGLAQNAPLVTGPTASIDAHRLYLRGRQALNARTSARLRESIGFFSSALELDPEFALAHVGVAEAELLLGVYGVKAPNEAMPASRAAAERALALQPGLGEALAARATTRAVFEWNWEEAERDFLAALLRRHAPPSAAQWYALYVLVPQGRLNEARERLEHALRQDPLSPALTASLGQIALFARDYDAAIAYQSAAIDLAADFFPAHLFLAQALTETGHADDAITALSKALELSGRSSEVLAALSAAHALAGQQPAANDLYRELVERAAGAYVSPVLRGLALTALGRPDEALDALEAARECHAADLIWIGVRPAFDPISPSPRFAGLLRDIGLRN
jgi:eukaryotic-like serine/threonine-protein kinase